MITLGSNTDASATIDNDNNDNDDQVVPIPPGLFDIDPTPETVETLTNNVTSDNPIKVKR